MVPRKYCSLPGVCVYHDIRVITTVSDGLNLQLGIGLRSLRYILASYIVSLISEANVHGWLTGQRRGFCYVFQHGDPNLAKTWIIYWTVYTAVVVGYILEKMQATAQCNQTHSGRERAAPYCVYYAGFFFFQQRAALPLQSTVRWYGWGSWCTIYEYSFSITGGHS